MSNSHMRATLRRSSLLPESPSRRERRTADIRERLFHSALELFARKGFAETTVEDITNSADVGKGTFFNHFPSKDHVLIAFSDMQLAKLRNSVAAAAESKIPMPQFLRGMAVGMTSEPGRNPSLIRAMLQANLSGSAVRGAIKRNHDAAQTLVAQLIRIGQERGEIRKELNPIEVAQVFRQVVFGTLLVWSVWGDSTLTGKMHSAFDILWGGIAPGGPSRVVSNRARASESPS